MAAYSEKDACWPEIYYAARANARPEECGQLSSVPSPSEGKKRLLQCEMQGKLVHIKNWVLNRYEFGYRFVFLCCQALHRPFGQNTHVVNALLQCDFDQPEVRDRFCIICRRAYASAHCADHDLHHHEQAAAAAPAPPPEVIV